MCLYSRTKWAMIAKEDIPIYKILRINIYGLNRDKKPFFTPIYDRPVAVPSTLWCRSNVRAVEGTLRGVVTFSIGKGMIHCYPYDKKAVMDSDILMSLSVIAYGYIPEDTPYYEDDRELCARKIRLEGIAAQSDRLALENHLPGVPSLSEWLESKVI